VLFLICWTEWSLEPEHRFLVAGISLSSFILQKLEYAGLNPIISISGESMVSGPAIHTIGLGFLITSFNCEGDCWSPESPTTGLLSSLLGEQPTLLACEDLKLTGNVLGFVMLSCLEILSGKFCLGLRGFACSIGMY